MSEKKRMTWKEGLFLAVFLVLCITGITFLVLSMAQDEPGTGKLSVGLGCIAVANWMNLIHIKRRKKGDFPQ